MKYVLWFGDIDKSMVKEAGGKGANLGEMTHAQVPVPPGFVLSSSAYFDFIEKTGVRQKIFELMHNLDVRDTAQLNKVSDELKHAITSAEILPEIRAEVLEAYHELCGSTSPDLEQMIFVAVRSSATAEDLPEASFAGQHATFLNVRRNEDLIEAVKGCWASLFDSTTPSAPIFLAGSKGSMSGGEIRPWMAVWNDRYCSRRNASLVVLPYQHGRYQLGRARSRARANSRK